MVTTAAEEKRAKQLLEQIRRMPHNKRCVNCDKESIAGHNNVCTKFQTFVCNTCKSAHQSFSHRCKSISLSNWTHTEVHYLSDSAGGGNANARLTWLGKLQGHLRLRPDDPLDKVKAFVNDAYNHNRYWKEKEAAGTNSYVATTERPGSVSSELESVAFTQQRRQQREGMLSTSTTKFPHVRADTAPTPVAAPVVTDLLDFFGDFTQATLPSVTPSHRPIVDASHGTARPPSGGAGDFAFQTGKGNSNSGIVSSAAPRASPSYSPVPTGPPPQADDWQHFGPTVASSSVPGDSTFFATSAVVPASNFYDCTNGSAFGFMSSGPSATPHHNEFCDFAAASVPPCPTGRQQPLTCTAPPPRPVPPAMRLTRPLIEDPFEVLAPPQQPSFSSASSNLYIPSQQPHPWGPMPASAMLLMKSGDGSLQANRTSGDGGCGSGRNPHRPSHMQTQPPRPSDPQMPMMTMNGGGAASGPPRRFLPSQGMVGGPRPHIPVYGQHQQQQYSSQASDPFAGLDWRK
ncbi:hypothetical protein VYU27_001210 [Nannochloropsis oceanica]